jgi:hypothetical protein
MIHPFNAEPAMRTLAEVCSAAIAFAYRSIDRLTLNAYIPMYRQEVAVCPETTPVRFDRRRSDGRNGPEPVDDLAWNQWTLCVGIRTQAGGRRWHFKPGPVRAGKFPPAAGFFRLHWGEFPLAFS